MTSSDNGALGATYKITRALQVASLIAITGMTANFVSEMVSAGASPPPVFVGILSIVCIAVLYCAITVILYLDNILPFLVNTVVDSLFLIALVVVSVVIGKPVSFFNCREVGRLSNATSSAIDFTSALGNSLNQNGGRIDFSKFVGTSSATCYEIKSIWGLSIALCVLFTFSAICSVCMWKRVKQCALKKGEA